jgi:hypothetical protein
MTKARKLAAVLFATAAFATAASPAVGAIQDGPGKGNPDVNASGKCPGGQNKDTSTGGLKKCP